MYCNQLALTTVVTSEVNYLSLLPQALAVTECVPTDYWDTHTHPSVHHGIPSQTPTTLFALRGPEVWPCHDHRRFCISYHQMTVTSSTHPTLPYHTGPFTRNRASREFPATSKANARWTSFVFRWWWGVVAVFTRERGRHVCVAPLSDRF